MTPRLSIGPNGNPIRVRCLDIVVGGVRISPRNHDHPEFSTASHEFAKRIAVTEPLTAVMIRNFCWIIGNASAGAQANGIGLRSLEVIEPELRTEFARIIL